MSERARTEDITTTPEYQKMRAAYPDLPENSVRQLAEQARRLETEKAAAEPPQRRENFNTELQDKLVDIIARLIIKYNFDIWGQVIVIRFPKVEIPYQSVSELAQYINVSLEKQSPPPPQMPPAYIAPPAPAPPAAAAAPPKRHGVGARIFYRVLNYGIAFVGAYLIFTGVYSFLVDGHVEVLIWVPVGLAILFLLRYIPRN